ncbi:MAG: hypothetical protein ACYCTF_13575 [Acidiferrobacter sp.]
MGAQKHLVVLGRCDHTEAMRVAAGLTIFGHTVRLILMTEPVADTAENALQVETLELAEVPIETTVPDQGLPCLDVAGLGAAFAEADAVISL